MSVWLLRGSRKLYLTDFKQLVIFSAFFYAF